MSLWNVWLEEQEEVYERVLLQGADKNANFRKEILKRDLSLAEGKSGERLCDALREAMHEGNGILYANQSF